jgi:S1-C subfamily serine protease
VCGRRDILDLRWLAPHPRKAAPYEPEIHAMPHTALRFDRELLLAFAACALLAHSPAFAKGAEPAATDPSRSTVSVQRDVGGGRVRGGTGTVIACEGKKSLVLTNAHVADDPAASYTVVHAGTTYPATYVAGSPVRQDPGDEYRVDGPDLALVSVGATLPVATIARDAPRAGERVRLWGFGGRPVERGAAEKAGEVLDATGYTEPTFISSTDTTSGDSGSGVFNEIGELVAVHWGGDGRKAHAVPLGTVRSFLRDKAGASFPDLATRLGSTQARSVPGP